MVLPYRGTLLTYVCRLLIVASVVGLCLWMVSSYMYGYTVYEYQDSISNKDNAVIQFNEFSLSGLKNGLQASVSGFQYVKSKLENFNLDNGAEFMQTSTRGIMETTSFQSRGDAIDQQNIDDEDLHIMQSSTFLPIASNDNDIIDETQKNDGAILDAASKFSAKQEPANNYAPVKKCYGDTQLCYLGDLETGDPLSLPVPIPFIKNYNNPCFYDRNENFRCFPRAFDLAPQKSGTNDIFRHLIQHHEIFTGMRKEPQFWDRGIHHYYEHGKEANAYRPPTVDDYLNFFENATINISKIRNSEGYYPAITMDYSSSLIYDQLLWKRLPQNRDQPEPIVGPAQMIKHILPNSKFIAVFRDPVERLYSDYRFFRHISAEDFHNLAIEGIEWFKNCTKQANVPYRTCVFDSPIDIDRTWLPEKSWHPAVRIRIGMYVDLLQEWTSLFPRENFYITRLEDYSKDRPKVYNEMFQFLGVDTLSKEVLDDMLTDVYFQTSERRYVPILPETYKLLKDFYQPFNERLAKLLGHEKFKWDDVKLEIPDPTK